MVTATDRLLQDIYLLCTQATYASTVSMEEVKYAFNMLVK